MKSDIKDVSVAVILTPGGGGGLPYETDGDARLSLRGVNFGRLGSLRVF